MLRIRSGKEGLKGSSTAPPAAPCHRELGASPCAGAAPPAGLPSPPQGLFFPGPFGSGASTEPGGPAAHPGPCLPAPGSAGAARPAGRPQAGTGCSRTVPMRGSHGSRVPAGIRWPSKAPAVPWAACLHGMEGQHAVCRVMCCCLSTGCCSWSVQRLPHGGGEKEMGNRSCAVCRGSCWIALRAACGCWLGCSSVPCSYPLAGTEGNFWAGRICHPMCKCCRSAA